MLLQNISVADVPAQWEYLTSTLQLTELSEYMSGGGASKATKLSYFSQNPPTSTSLKVQVLSICERACKKVDSNYTF